jgi:hypothetical protein
MGRFDHSSWQLAILKWFLRPKTDWNIRVRPELRIQSRPPVIGYRIWYYSIAINL